MKSMALVTSCYFLASSALAQVTAETPVSDQQFMKSCQLSTVAKSTPYCACLALQIASAAQTEKELLFARQMVASYDPAFGFPRYKGKDQKVYMKIFPKVMQATGTCGKAATLKTLNEDGTLK